MDITTPVVIVAALGKETRAIGKDNDLLWHIPADLKRFKELTHGHPIIMGRKTFESILSILGKPLPGRTNIVITRDETYAHEGTTVCHTLEDALQKAQEENPAEIHIGGGAQLYEQALPFTTRLHLTLIDDTQGGDTFFPDYTDDFVATKEYEVAEHNGITYQWVDYKRQTQ